MAYPLFHPIRLFSSFASQLKWTLQTATEHGHKWDQTAVTEKLAREAKQMYENFETMPTSKVSRCLIPIFYEKREFHIS